MTPIFGLIALIILILQQQDVHNSSLVFSAIMVLIFLIFVSLTFSASFAITYLSIKIGDPLWIVDSLGIIGGIMMLWALGYLDKNFSSSS